MKILSNVLVKAGILVEGDVTVNNLTATAYVVANTVWVNGSYRNNNNGNMSLAFSGTTVSITTDAGNVINAFGTGNVGIGQSVDAGYKLDVNGEIRGSMYRGANGAPLITFDGATNRVKVDNQGYGTTTGHSLIVNDYLSVESKAVFNTYVRVKGNNSVITYAISRPDAPALDYASLAGMGVKFNTAWYTGAGLSFYVSEGVDISGGSNVAEKLNLSPSGDLKVFNLAGTGNRMVVADSSGVLSTQAIPPTITNYVTTDTTQTISGQKTFSALTTIFDSTQTATFIEGKASGVLYGGMSFSLYMQFNAYAAATGGYLWKNGAGNNVMALSQAGALTVNNLAGSGVRMVVADANGLLSTQSFSANVNAFQEYTYTATAGQTTFAATYTVGQVFVYYNGSKLEPAEYTATDGTSIVITPGVNAGDIVDIIAYQTGAGIGYGSLSATGPLAYNNTTGVFSIQQANGSQAGYLSSADWTTFNNKQNALTNPVTGTGTSGNLAKFTGTSTIGNSLITDNGTTVSVLGYAYDGVFRVGSSSNSLYFTPDGGGVGIAATAGGYTGQGIYLAGGAGAVEIHTNSTPRIFVTNDGKIGFGTTSPSQILHVYGSSVRPTIESTGNGGYSSLRFIGKNSAGVSRAFEVGVNINADDVWQITNSSAAFMNVNTSGYVGIATSTPGSYLDIRPSTYNRVQTYFSGVYTSGVQFSDLLGGVWHNAAIDQLNIHSNAAGGYITLTTNSLERFRVTNTGVVQVGNGSYSPYLKLKTGGSTAYAGVINTDSRVDYIQINGGDSTGYGSGASVSLIGSDRYGTATAGQLEIAAGSAANQTSYGYIAFHTANTLRMQISFNGAIGTTAGGTNIYNPSDLRLKKNITETPYGLNEVLLLKPSKFNWKDGFSESEKNKNMLGFIAQEVKEVIPEAVESFGGDVVVKTNGYDFNVKDPLRVNEKFIIPVLVKSIQEEDAKVNAQELRIQQLEQEVITLKAQLGTN